MVQFQDPKTAQMPEKREKPNQTTLASSHRLGSDWTNVTTKKRQKGKCFIFTQPTFDFHHVSGSWCPNARKYSIWEGRKVPTKSLFGQEAPKIGTQKCSTKRGVRKPSHACRICPELVKAEVFEKRVFEQTAPLNE